MTYSGDEIWSAQPAAIWAEGYPIGNGRLGAMVAGQPCAERVSLNHDRLWRRYWKYQRHNLAGIFPHYQKLCLQKRWDEAYDLVKDKLPVSGQAIYVNPFVPLGDLGLYPHHFGRDDMTRYKRLLDLDRGLVEVTYQAGGISYKREYFVSAPAGVLVINLKSSQAGRTSGEVSLYRILDRECDVSGQATLDELVMEGQFEEGVRFAGVARVIANGGRLTRGIKDYLPPPGKMPEKSLSGFTFGFRDLAHPAAPAGVSTCFDSADEVTILVALATDRDAGQEPAGWCRRKLDKVDSTYQQLLAEHVEDHQPLYRRTRIHLSRMAVQNKSTPELVEEIRQTGKTQPVLISQLFNLGRYLAIAAGRPAAPGELFKAPINLQGLWNEDPRPAWDCDYHLDLNVQMCYWGLGPVNLADMGSPLVDWAYSLLPKAKVAAKDIYGLGGAFYNAVCDVENLGNCDDLFMLAAGTNAWLCQTLWNVWEYRNDQAQLRNKIYPIMREVARFFEEFLKEDAHGRLVTAPSGSPENCPNHHKNNSILSVTSSFDLEVLHELFGHLLEASDVLGLDVKKRSKWSAMLKKLPLPSLNKEGRLLEWLDEDYATVDPGHRHRSHLVGLCPGQRITVEDTPDDAAAALNALELRHSFGGKGSCTLDVVSDAAIYARLYRPAEALGKLRDLVANHAMGNLLLCLCDWRPESSLRWFGDRRVFQVEASFGAMSAVTDLLLQDRGGLLRLLPALPEAWADGEVKGLRARGGFEADLRWAGGRLVEARIVSSQGLPCRVKIGGVADNVVVTRQGQPVPVTTKDGVHTFPTTTGGEYVLSVS